MKHNIRLWIASDNTHGAYHTAETETLDIIKIAQKYGRAERGELVELTEVDGVATEAPDRPTAHWDSQFRRYKLPAEI